MSLPNSAFRLSSCLGANKDDEVDDSGIPNRGRNCGAGVVWLEGCPVAVLGFPKSVNSEEDTTRVSAGLPNKVVEPESFTANIDVVGVEVDSTDFPNNFE